MSSEEHGLAGYNSSSSEDGENTRNNSLSKGLKKIPSSMSSTQPSSAEKRHREASPYSPSTPTKRSRHFQESDTALGNNETDSLKDTNNYKQQNSDLSGNSTMESHSRLIQSSEVDADLKAHLSTLLGKVDQLLTYQHKVLKNQERLLALLESNIKYNNTEGSKPQTVRALISSPSPVDNVSLSTPKHTAGTPTTSESDISFTDFKVPALPSENNLLSCINSILTNQGIAQPSQDLKVDGQNVEPTAQTNQSKLFQEITLPADLQLESVGTDTDHLNKDEMPYFTDSDSDRMKDLLCWAQKIKSKSCSIGNFSTNLVKLLFTKEEIHNKNCSGTRGKKALDPDKLAFVKYCTFRLYNKCDTFEQESIWRKKCIVSIDEYLRRGNRTRANSRSVSQEGLVDEDDKNKDEQPATTTFDLIESGTENPVQIVVIPTSVS
ncbi:uncharacterized protein LOC110247561 isoform X2 [Exaiptasia diaphana]|uniref:BEN domain-containing protein n=1 Tax=Exaiptasia diaphana TaxID=2652724 RepID=A0A913XTW5_EXADI|nr:uncharacterized protein LOC110247561 isoform X2 [Exaiptasia diaphana]